MRVRRLALGLTLPLSAVGIVVACRAPTQAEVRVGTTARCDEISGVAITVKDAPVSAELAVVGEFVNATTHECAGGQIGTLVLAPGADTGAVVVIAGYKGQDPTRCKPPSYANCIVARRAFSFVDHTTLRIPISLDPDCANVPCDAFSTCSKGQCVSAAVSCEGGDCTVNPGKVVIPDAGGVLPDGALPPQDGGGSDGGGSDGGGGDGGSGDGGGGGDAGDDGGVLDDSGSDGGVLGGDPGLAQGPFNCASGVPSCPGVCTPGPAMACYANFMMPNPPVMCTPKPPKASVQFCCSVDDCTATGAGIACCIVNGRPVCSRTSCMSQPTTVCFNDAQCTVGCNNFSLSDDLFGGGWKTCK